MYEPETLLIAILFSQRMRNSVAGVEKIPLIAAMETDCNGKREALKCRICSARGVNCLERISGSFSFSSNPCEWQRALRTGCRYLED
jgi:hypothetical protein